MLVWNVRGFNKKSRQDVIRELIASTRPDVVCLQETKIQNMLTQILLSMLGADFDNHVCLPAACTRSGILIAWKNTCCNAITTRIDRFSASVLF